MLHERRLLSHLSGVGPDTFPFLSQRLSGSVQSRCIRHGRNLFCYLSTTDDHGHAGYTAKHYAEIGITSTAAR